MNPTLVQCFVLAVLAIIGLEQCWASANVGQWGDSDGSLYARLIKCQHIYIAIVPLLKIYMRRSANVVADGEPTLT